MPAEWQFHFPDLGATSSAQESLFTFEWYHRRCVKTAAGSYLVHYTMYLHLNAAPRNFRKQLVALCAS